MGALTFDALLRSLKPEARAPDPVYYLHGDEDVLKDEALRALTARAVEAAARDFNVDTRSTADLDVEVAGGGLRSEEHTSELQSREELLCSLLLGKNNIDSTMLYTQLIYTHVCDS